MKRPIKQEAWYPYAVAACIAVVLYVVLVHTADIFGGIGTFLGYFRAVILGCVLAYLVNPLAKFLARVVFKPIKSERVRDLLAIALAFVIVICFLAFALVLLIPQIVESIGNFVNNLNGYIDSLNGLIASFGLNVDLNEFIDTSGDMVGAILAYLSDNITKILSMSMSAGKGIFTWLVAFIISIYALGAKDKLIAGIRRLVKAICGEKRYEGVHVFASRCNAICNRYIVFNIIDSIIVGCANAVFMSIVGMQYVGLVSFVVAIANLIPTFGPVVGAVIGGFILLMVKPMHAIIFLIFAFILQTIDGYILKPRLFGSSLGVSGIWILIGIIVGGNMFGIVGILLAIPAVAILDFVYRDYLIPRLENRHKEQE